MTPQKPPDAGPATAVTDAEVARRIDEANAFGFREGYLLAEARALAAASSSAEATADLSDRLRRVETALRKFGTWAHRSHGVLIENCGLCEEWLAALAAAPASVSGSVPASEAWPRLRKTGDTTYALDPAGSYVLGFFPVVPSSEEAGER